MEDQNAYTVESLVLDESFQRWVLSNNIDGAVRWERWISQHPESRPVVDQAAIIIKQLHQLRLSNKFVLDDNEVANLWNRIMKYDDKKE